MAVSLKNNFKKQTSLIKTNHRRTLLHRLDNQPLFGKNEPTRVDGRHPTYSYHTLYEKKLKIDLTLK